MRHIVLLFLIPLIISCAQPKKISEKEVMETFNQFFYYLDNDVDKIRDYLSEDFMIFEVSKKWDTEGFIKFVEGFGEFESKREYRNMIIDTDLNSAHITLEHSGEFELEKPTPEGVTFLSYEWLESAYMIKEDGKLKFKFYFSEQINDQKLYSKIISFIGKRFNKQIMPYKCQSCGSKTANLKYCDSCIIRYNFSNDDAKAEEAQKIDDNTITFEKKWFVGQYR